MRGGLHQDEIKADNSVPQASSSDGAHVRVGSEFHDTIAIELPDRQKSPQLFALCQPQQDSTGRAGLCC